MIFILIYLFILGSILGSYAVATVWRLRAQELVELPKDGFDQQQLQDYHTLVNQSGFDTVKVQDDYSRCLHCQHRLVWYDLIPIISWLSLAGKCRYCRKSIGGWEFGAEAGLGLVFVFSYWMLAAHASWILISLWLVLLVILAILFIYDAKWQLLPTKILWLAIFVAVIFMIVSLFEQTSMNHQELIQKIVHYCLSVGVLGGLYWCLALISKESWVGWGDGYLGCVMGLILGNVWLAIIGLFLANLLGCVCVFIKAVITHKNIRHMRVAFGPMLIVALIIVYLLQTMIIEKLSWLMVDI